MTLPDPPAVVAVCIGLAACVTDLRTRRIPNTLTLGGALAAVAFHLATGGVAAGAAAIFGWTVGVAIFFLPFALGGMGGGDVKLVAALGAWLGPGPAVWLALYTGLAGGVLALALAVSCGYLRQALANIGRLLAHWREAGLQPLEPLTLARSTAPHLAYAVPILLGTVVAIWTR